MYPVFPVSPVLHVVLVRPVLPELPVCLVLQVVPARRHFSTCNNLTDSQVAQLFVQQGVSLRADL